VQHFLQLQPALLSSCCCFGCCCCSSALIQIHFQFWHHLDARGATDANLIWTPRKKSGACECLQRGQKKAKKRGAQDESEGKWGVEDWVGATIWWHNLHFSVCELQLMMLQALACGFLI